MAVILDHLMNLSSIVHFHRKKSGLTQKALADLAGVGKTVVFEIENGKTSIQFDTLIKVLKALNIRINYSSPIIHLMSADNEDNQSL